MIANARIWILALVVAFASGAHGAAVDDAAGTITLSLTTEPPSLDASLVQDTVSNLILGLTNEGLVDIGRRGEIVPAVAERWEETPTRITFHLRDGARWANGDPVTAADFVYSFRRLVDPATGASGSAYLADIINNAAEILKGELPPEALGVRAINDATLEVNMSRPVPYALYVLAGNNYTPLHRAFVETQGENYGADADNILENGPFLLDEWVHSASVVLRKNPDYWGSDEIRLNAIDFGYITADNRSLFNLYKSGELAALRLDEQVLKDAASTNHRIRKTPTNCIGYLYLNQAEGRPLSNRKLRLALRAAIDRDSFVNNIVALPGTKRIDSIYTEAIQAERGAFVREFPGPEISYDLAQARQWLAEAKREMGVDEIPPIVLLANERRQVHAEFIQSQLRSALDLDIRVDKQTFKQAIAKMFDGDFDISSAGFCGGSLVDPLVFAGMFESSSPFNRGQFSNARYDELIELTHSTADQAVRMSAFNEAQQILFDEAGVIPTHQLSWVYVQHPALRGLRRYPSVNFSTGFIDR